jgi:transcriptional regulator with XRE-family HTH domain
LANERLRAAIHQAGLEVDELAARIDADPKTVRRWISGREPRGSYRTRLARELGTTEAELWPELDLRIEGQDERGEILAAYAQANALAAPDWRALLQTAQDQIDLLDLTLADILPAAGTTELLTQKAQAGCQIRLLVSAPDSAHLALTDAEQDENISLLDIPDSAREAERSLSAAAQLAGTEGVEARTFIAGRFYTILRFDEEMLVVLHLYGTPAEAAPLLHLKRHSDHGIFERFAAHFDAIWQAASAVLPPPLSAG